MDSKDHCRNGPASEISPNEQAGDWRKGPNGPRQIACLMLADTIREHSRLNLSIRCSLCATFVGHQEHIWITLYSVVRWRCLGIPPINQTKTHVPRTDITQFSTQNLPMSNRFRSLLLFIMFFGPAVEGDSGEPIRVMSFNLRYGKAKDGDNRWERRDWLVARTIKAFQPDLLGTQETLSFQAEYLKEELSGYSYFGRSRMKTPNVTAGLKWAPLTGPNIKMMA